METFMRTVTTRPSNPTARIIVNGLALLCFSRQNDRAEVGFLEVEGHPLWLTIYNSDCGIAKDAQGNDLNFEITGGSIEIISGDGGVGSLYIPESTDQWDFSNMLNLDDVHKKIPLAPSGHPTIREDSGFMAEMYIGDGVFFTECVCSSMAEISQYQSSDPPFTSGHYGKVYGADLDGDQVTVSISELNKPIVLDRLNKTFSISIRYKCTDTGSTTTDFHRFYDVLDLPTGHFVCDLNYQEWEDAYRHLCETSLIEQSENNEEGGNSLEENESNSNLIQNIMMATEACQASCKPLCPENLRGIPEPC